MHSTEPQSSFPRSMTRRCDCVLVLLCQLLMVSAWKHVAARLSVPCTARWMAVSTGSSQQVGYVCEHPALCLRLAAQVVKRFYKKVDVVSFKDSAGCDLYTVTLDGRRLKTPAKELLAVRNATLAHLIATEWDNQPANLIRHDMHVTSLAYTAIDQAKARPERTERLVEHLNTDAVCYRHDFPEELCRAQIDNWDPVIQWFSKQFAAPISTTTSIIALKQSSEALQAYKNYVASLNSWGFEGLEFAVDCSKSPIITAALLHGHIDAVEATRLCRLETDFQVRGYAYAIILPISKCMHAQTSRWGEVEWSHGLERASTQSRLAAAALFVRLSHGEGDHASALL